MAPDSHRQPNPPSRGNSGASAMPPPDHIPSRSLSGQQPNMADVAGVLRRNQACLNCRRRKLKCDAVRPNCGTCVRSYKHLCRTSPQGNHVLACEYEDATGSAPEFRASPNMEPNDDDGAKKRKRKASGEAKKAKSEEEDENLRLRRKIELLEARLATQGDTPEQPQQQQQQWAGPPPSSVSAPSPTALLEMLSSAASAQASGSLDSSSTVTGLRDGAVNAMMSTAWASTPKDSSMPSTGLTPFLSFADNQSAQTESEREKREGNGISPSTHESRRSSAFGAMSSSYGASTSSPSNAPMPSPGTFLNFSPAAAASTSTSHQHQHQHQQDQHQPQTENINWPPPPGPHGTLDPSTRTEGPWRAVETVYNYQEQTINGEKTAEKNQPAGDINEAIQQQLLLDIFWPGWPQTLPEPNIVNDLVEAFFDREPYLPRLLHRPRLLARLALPPTHSNFPHPALIHAICAAAASWCDPSIYEKSSRNHWVDEKNTSFSIRQAAYGKEAVQDGLNTGNRLFDVVRAMIILSRVFIDDTRMLECWAYGGLVARMMLPLGINVRSAELSLKSVMLPPPADALEREERRVAVWMAFYHDTISSAASGWGTSISIDELTIPLPVSTKDFEAGREEMSANPQDLESVDLWTKHPVPDSYVMLVKATILLNRVNRFVRKWKNRHLRDDDDYDGLNRPEFRELANAIACFQMSFPPNLRNTTKLNAKRQLDINVVASHLIPQAAIICLYEPFADISDPNDAPSRRLLGATQAVVTIVQQLANTTTSTASNALNVMHSGVSVCLVTAARTALIFYRQALNVNDQVTAESHRMDIEMIRSSLHAFGIKSKIGNHHAQLLEYFVDRARSPDYAKLQAHYPTHPRDGAPELHPAADFGLCVTNALNIKRGFWRKWSQIYGNAVNGVSPFGSTPETSASSAAAMGPSTGGSTGVSSSTDASARISALPSDSPSSMNQTAEQGPSKLYGNMAFGSCSGTGFPSTVQATRAANYDKAGSSQQSPIDLPPYSGPNGSFTPEDMNSQEGANARATTQFDSIGTLKDGQTSVFAFRSEADEIVRAPSTPGLSNELERIFNSVEDVRPDGHRLAYSVMTPGGPMK